MATRVSKSQLNQEAVSGLHYIVRVATTVSGTLATAYQNGSVVDSITLATLDVILLKDQSTGAENGVYIVNASGAPTRAPDYDADAEIRPSTIHVKEGTVNGGKLFRLTNTSAITVNTTSITYTEIGGSGGAASLPAARVPYGDGTSTYLNDPSFTFATVAASDILTIGDATATAASAIILDPGSGATAQVQGKDKTSAASNAFRLRSGNSTGNFSSGAVSLRSGTTSGTSPSGNVDITSGNATGAAANSGTVALASGASSSGTRGSVTLSGNAITILAGALNEIKASDIASASTIDLTASTGNLIHVTGTTTITAITLGSGYERTIVFDSTLTLTYNATTLILPGGIDIVTVAGDTAIFRGDGSGNTRCISYTRTNPSPISVSGSGTVAVALSLSETFSVVPSGNITLNLSLPISGKTYGFIMKQGATPYTIGFTQTIKWKGGTVFTATNSANAIDIVTIFYDGTNYYGTFGNGYA